MQNKSEIARQEKCVNKIICRREKKLNSCIVMLKPLLKTTEPCPAVSSFFLRNSAEAK